MNLNVPTFRSKLQESGFNLSRTRLKTLQINLGKLCNQACLHCHVEAGPKRTEIMNEATALRLVELASRSSSLQSIDLTGGAPELNPYFRSLVTSFREMKLDVMDRCNLTVLFEPGQEDTAEFLARNQVQVVASLPCYSKSNVEKQRGNGVFDKSLRALQ